MFIFAVVVRNLSGKKSCRWFVCLRFTASLGNQIGWGNDSLRWENGVKIRVEFIGLALVNKILLIIVVLSTLFLRLFIERKQKQTVNSEICTCSAFFSCEQLHRITRLHTGGCVAMRWHEYTQPYLFECKCLIKISESQMYDKCWWFLVTYSQHLFDNHTFQPRFILNINIAKGNANYDANRHLTHQLNSISSRTNWWWKMKIIYKFHDWPRIKHSLVFQFLFVSTYWKIQFIAEFVPSSSKSGENI